MAGIGYIPYESSTLPIKCVDIGDVLREASQNTSDSRSEYQNLTTGVVKESQYQFKFHPNPAKPIFLQGPEALRHLTQNKYPKQIFVILLINLKNLSFSQSDSYDMDDDCTIL
jgi:hypothetical protein